jgi:methylmalonyl-CoA/ethylmalonyl-CoA epimerase
LKIVKLDHVGIAVRNVDEALQFYGHTLQGKLTVRKGLGTTKDHTYTQLKIGKSKIELIEPLGHCEFLERFFEKKGEGLHHLTFEVDNIFNAIDHLEERGLRVVDKDVTDPNWMTAFISPKDTSGVLIQFYSRQKRNGRKRNK